MTLYKWSQTASINALVDNTCPWPEGMDPAQINDSARGNMAAIAKYRDDLSGTIVTTGTSTAYVLSSFQGFDSLADMDGKEIWFTPHVTNGANGTSLNVDGLGVKPLLPAPGVGLQGGVLIQGTPYGARYSNTDGAWYLKGLFGNPYNIPVGATIEWWGVNAPNSSFAFPFGQALSRTTYAALFGILGTTWGPGLNDGLTFSLPDLRGRVTACPDQLPGSGDAGRLAGGNMSARLSLGGSGGEAAHQLSAAEIPQLPVSVSGTITVNSTVSDVMRGPPLTNANVGGSNPVRLFSQFDVITSQTITSTGSNSMSGQANTGVTAAVHNNLPPTILCNRIMRII